jgi:formyl-CoA transferase
MVRNVGEAVSLPGLSERAVKLPLRVPNLPDTDDVSIVNAGFLFGSDRPHVDEPPPRLGEHTEHILTDLGFSPAERSEIMRFQRME